MANEYALQIFAEGEAMALLKIDLTQEAAEATNFRFAQLTLEAAGGNREKVDGLLWIAGPINAQQPRPLKFLLTGPTLLAQPDV